MRRAAWTLILLTACSDPPVQGICRTDTNTIAFCWDGVDAGGPTLPCHPLLQTGCNAGEKCTWVIDQALPPVGHMGCAPNGAQPTLKACTTGAAGPAGYDNCEKGSFCADGVCRQLCDLEGNAPTCDLQHTCVAYLGISTLPLGVSAGVCEETCDPLTQISSRGDAACRANDADTPDRGCYGASTFACSPTSEEALLRTDRSPAPFDLDPFTTRNACAPGFIPLFFEADAYMEIRCMGLCAALPTDNSPEHSGNALGDAAALGKLPNELAVEIGHATCASDRKGSTPTSECVFLWPLVVDAADHIEITEHADRIGYCVSRQDYKYDADNDGVRETTYPSCSTLPPRSSSTPGRFDDAADWGCQTIAASMLDPTAPLGSSVVRDFRIGFLQARLERD